MRSRPTLVTTDDEIMDRFAVGHNVCAGLRICDERDAHWIELGCLGSSPGDRASLW
jgi:hypothetical protein